MKKKLARDIIQWDVISWSKALMYWENNVDWNKIQNGLELGGQAGGLSLWLALKGKEVVCSDLKDAKITAAMLHSEHQVSSLIKYQDIDATNIPYENFFDIVVFKSIVGGIGRNDREDMQRKVFKEIRKALKPGGTLLFAENLAASPLHQLLRKKFVNWGSSWRYIPLNEMKEFLHIFSSYSLKTAGVAGTFGRNERQRNLLATVDRLLLNRICPDNWKYIAYGIAVK